MKFLLSAIDFSLLTVKIIHMNTKTPPVNSPNPQEVTLSKSVKCQIAEGWGGAGQLGQYFGSIECNERTWAIVLWDDEEEPNLSKAESILIESTSWSKL